MPKALQTSKSIRQAASTHPAITPTEVGLINEHLQRGEHDRARLILATADKRQADREAAPVPRDLTKVTEALNAVRITLRKLESRIAKLEARQPLAKAAHPPAKRQRTTSELMAMVSAYVDNPVQSGVLSSMLQSGDPAQVLQAEQALLAAKRQHETRKIQQERLGWSR